MQLRIAHSDQRFAMRYALYIVYLWLFFYCPNTASKKFTANYFPQKHIEFIILQWIVSESEDFDQDNNEEDAFKIDLTNDIPPYFHFDGQNPNVILGCDQTIRAVSYLIRRIVVWKGCFLRIDDLTARCVIYQCEVAI